MISLCDCTWLSLVDEDGRMGRQNFFMEPMAAGKAGAEKSAATRFIRKIQDIISSSLLERERKRDNTGMGSGTLCAYNKNYIVDVS